MPHLLSVTKPSPGKSDRSGGVEVVAEEAGAGGVAELRQRLLFDLPSPFTGDTVGATDLVEGVRAGVGQAETQLDDPGFALGEGAEHLLDLFVQEVGRG